MDINEAFEKVNKIVVVIGPTLQEIVRPWIVAESLEGDILKNYDTAVKFETVQYYDKNSVEIDASVLGPMIFAQVLSVEPQNGELWNFKRGSYIITIRLLDKTFRGDYSTRQLEGELWLVA